MNKDNYKKAIDQIHASDSLKEKTFMNMQKQNNNYMKYLSIAAVFAIVFFSGIINFEDKEIAVIENPEIIPEPEVVASMDLPRFQSMDELINVLKENSESSRNYYFNGAILETDQAVNDLVMAESAVKGESINTSSDFSTTNVQVENVDEADIVKTDGEYIYYVTNNTLFIVRAEGLEIISKIEIKNDEERFNLNEIFLKDDKVVLLGNSYIKEEPIVYNSTDEKLFVDRVYYNNTSVVKAIVYNISNREIPEKTREVVLEGYYVNSRMIGDNLYLVTNKVAYYRENDDTILPLVKDSVVNLEKRVAYSDVIYFKDTKNMSFTMVGGFNINDNEEINVETFFGAGETVYANEKNMYLTQVRYNYGEAETTIYKMNLINSKLKMQAKATVKGYLNNQFSMDEYEGNLRVATTANIVLEPQKDEYLGSGVVTTSLAKTTTTNNLYVFNEYLEEIGKVENLANDERIYSVRFIGKIGYIVTFKQVDPLFVIDLSDPINPVVKGELKIPGYSSYLHPYDENHIIGIGYNTKDNGFGGVTISTMKMSMFDVSDLENPKELFNVSIGDNYSSSEVLYNHKTLFTKFTDNLIGFPLTDYNKQGFIIYEIDMNNNEFSQYMKFDEKYDYRTRVDRLIYIEDILYSLSNKSIKAYDLNLKEEVSEIYLENKEEILDYMY